MNQQSQTAVIKKHLEKGMSITPLEAFKYYGCLRLGDRIFDLRDEGMSIETEMITVDRKRVAKYYLKCKCQFPTVRGCNPEYFGNCGANIG